MFNIPCWRSREGVWSSNTLILNCVFFNSFYLFTSPYHWNSMEFILVCCAGERQNRKKRVKFSASWLLCIRLYFHCRGKSLKRFSFQLKEPGIQVRKTNFTNSKNLALNNKAWQGLEDPVHRIWTVAPKSGKQAWWGQNHFPVQKG